MKTRLLFYCVTVLFLFFSKNTTAATYNWTGTAALLGDASWNNPLNWGSIFSYPGSAANDVAVFNASPLFVGNNPILTATLPNALSQMTVNSGITASVYINSGKTLVVSGAVVIGTGSAANLTITGPGAATMTGLTYGYQSSFTIGSSSISTTSVTLNASSVLNMSQNNSTFTNYGTLNLSTGCSWTAANSSPTINNYGTINPTNISLTWSGNSLAFTNSGTITALSGTLFTLSGPPQSFTNSGNISLNASQITSSGNSTPIINSGNITLTNASTFTISGGGSSPLTNSGNFTATSSTLNFTAGTGNTVTNSGVFNTTSSPITFGIKIVNVSGAIVKSVISSQPTWQDDIATFLPGTYIIQVLNNTDKSLVGKATFVKM